MTKPSNSSDQNMNQLAQKMLMIMKQVQHLPKNGHNRFHDYHYVTDTDVMQAFSQALSEHNVMLFTSIRDRTCQRYQRHQKEYCLVTVQLELIFIDVDTGEKYGCFFYGDGVDSDDKALYKAITGGLKYALLKTFLVSSGDDPEKTTPELTKTVDCQDSYKTLLEAAHHGMRRLRQAWQALPLSAQKEWAKQLPALKKIAMQHDVDHKRPVKNTE